MHVGDMIEDATSQQDHVVKLKMETAQGHLLFFNTTRNNVPRWATAELLTKMYTSLVNLFVLFQAEVTQLEGSLDNSDQGHFPPYLIPDTTSLCDSLQLVKQLTQTNKGIVIIPLAGECPCSTCNQFQTIFYSSLYYILGK